VSCYKRADRGPRDPVPWTFRVELTVPCPRGHALMAFHRLTLPGYEHEGVMFDGGRVGKSVIMTADGDDWAKIRLHCMRCPASVEVRRDRLEAELAAMWAPLATRRERKVWDAPR